jgi:hypothetical protein
MNVNASSRCGAPGFQDFGPPISKLLSAFARRTSIFCRFEPLDDLCHVDCCRKRDRHENSVWRTPL